MEEIFEKSFGQILKEARAKKKISLDKAQDETHIRKKFLEAIENEEFEKMPNEVSAKGFIRIYSEYLGLDPNEIIKKYIDITKNKQTSKGDLSKISSLPGFKKQKSSLFGKYFFIFIILIVVASSVYLFSLVKERKGKVVVKQNTVESVAEKSLLNEKTKNDRLLLSAEFIDRSWISVELDGKEAFTGLVGAGQKMFWEANNKIKIRAGNAGGVKVSVNEKPVGLLGKTGETVVREFVSQ